MKETVLRRINATYGYIKDYYHRHGIYPTFRDIQDELNYSSLSLLKRDIDSLVDLKKLEKNEHGKYVLIANENTSESFGFPLLFASEAVHKIDILNEDEKELLKLQYDYLKGNYLETISKLKSLYSHSKDMNVQFGCLLTECCCALYVGDSKPWREAFLTLLSFEPKTKKEKMGKDLSLYYLSTVLSSKENCPKWLKEGRFYGLTKKGFPLAKVTYVAMIISENRAIKPFLLEPLCSEAVAEGIPLCQVYMDLYLASCYHYVENDKYIKAHLTAAVDTCFRNGWIAPLVEMKKTLGTALDAILKEYGAEYVKRIDDLHKVLEKGYSAVYKSLLGDKAENRFTIREAEIANYVRLGLTNKEIAKKLNLSIETIKYHLSSAFVKANVSSRKELREIMNGK